MYYGSKIKYEYQLFKKKLMLIFHSFKSSGSTFLRLHQRLLKSFEEAAIPLRHLGKSILEGNLYLGPLEIILRTLASGMTYKLPVITCPAETLPEVGTNDDISLAVNTLPLFSVQSRGGDGAIGPLFKHI